MTKLLVNDKISQLINSIENLNSDILNSNGFKIIMIIDRMMNYFWGSKKSVGFWGYF